APMIASGLVENFLAVRRDRVRLHAIQERYRLLRGEHVLPELLRRPPDRWLRTALEIEERARAARHERRILGAGDAERNDATLDARDVDLDVRGAGRRGGRPCRSGGRRC